MKQKIIAVIPARYQASRFPGKLMELLGDKTVISTTYQNVVETGLFDEVFVATDSEVIFNEIKENGGKAVMTGTHETGSDRIAEAVKDIECDIVVNVQGDEPFLKKEPLKQLISIFDEDKDKSISLASLKIKLEQWDDIENPNNVKVITDNNGFALYFSRSVVPFPREKTDDLQYFKHIGVYAFRREALLEFSSLPMKPLEIAEKIECIRYLEYGMKIKMIETDFVGVGIDVPEDLEKAKQLLRL
ncbi:3-deoxy-manno-octulosonate cytidylyltransferase [Riemerella anatipestifer]|uniref:3-deoxy-manno-octulosonate cytidylyltransferase n=1 Tax=Riemerella anatipestifer (strain ATCC 11845 / DSM 15868 / JCM 9532 / NCTC 11014) TaxID=693978 RepID=E4TBL4_RIEAD|nr:3-deoxy-manno-octulosonate cytidylyltransferase [Riemerella anatipestifer]ADQ81843.1 3-deoxy-D-manno-octulosonatecytidylyltransferase [Riemerella anatipestifer ATCC 11845 = DSM 15868]ADZ12657.1 CMP-2-keto-3-deoxyoctulosonic acid synthetase [Riemerella anatipestifer RA-GD]AFD55854.1 3-deoxy-D-manno-octulosonatecytidylyltransferase [Riemerella anatipestifer ATCC 11845 = DSM 15868]AGC40243.1 CMP-2-keto-3-deoxyoctulosonic acid synthetase [Riemerella anatipestifer RA-CH-2]AKP70955.1 3-deoxy-D-ma